MSAPAWIPQVRKIQDPGRVRLGRIAHPDPDQAVALDRRIAAHAELGRNVVLSGDLHALAARVELEAVVHAAHAVAFDAAVRQARAAVAAAIVQRHRPARLAAVQHDGLVEDRAREHAPVDQLVVPGGHVPAVHEERLARRGLVDGLLRQRHGSLLWSSRASLRRGGPKRRPRAPSSWSPAAASASGDSRWAGAPAECPGVQRARLGDRRQPALPATQAS